MSRYTDLLAVRQYISPNGSLSSQDDGLIQSCIDRAEDGIDAYTRRTFAGTSGTVYYSRFEQPHIAGNALYLDRDLHTLVGLINGDSTNIPVGSVWMEPRNQGPPYRILRLKSAYVWVWNTDADVIVSGTFGYGTVAPDDIVQASIRYAVWLYRQKDLGGGAAVEVVGFPEAGEVQYPKGMPDDVRWLLSPYRSRSGGVI